MPSHAVEPGTRLVDRYRLEEPLGEAQGTTYWRAHDELLDRRVSVCLLPASHEHAPQVLRAARRAAALTDARFLRVLDASEVDDVVYVVSEWVSASNLVDLLADGPLPSPEARELALEIAQALSAAAREGLAHLCLGPEHVLRTAHGQVKLAGLAVDAAVRGVRADEGGRAAQLDARAAAAVAYAALTARWPLDGPSPLPAAPRDGSAVCSPRQVKAGVPHDLDAVVCRALDVPGHPGEPIGSPAELVAELERTQATGRMPVVRATPAERPATSVYPPAPTGYDDQPLARRGRATTLAWGAVVLVLAVGIALAGSQVMSALGGRTGPGPSSSPSSSTTASGPPTGTALTVAQISSFDPPPQGNGDENGDRAARAIDGDKNTVWTTKSYFDPFGPSGIKDGVGLLLDLGSARRIGSVSILVAGGATDLEVRASDTRGAQASDFPLITRAARGVDGPAVLRPDKPLTARYVLVWLTALPYDGKAYRGQIAEITVRS